MVAIVGEILAEPTENDDVCAAASRFYKYLVHDYLEEYNRSLRIFLEANVRVTMAQNAGELQSDLQFAASLWASRFAGRTTESSEWGLRNMESHRLRQVALRSSGWTFSSSFKTTFFYRRAACSNAVLAIWWLCAWHAHNDSHWFASWGCQAVRGEPTCRKSKEAGSVFEFLYFCSSRAETETSSSVLAADRLRFEYYRAETQDNSACWTRTFDDPLIKGWYRGGCRFYFDANSGCLEADPSLDLFQTIGSLLVTMGHLAMRLAQYKRYPCCLWKLTQKFKFRSLCFGNWALSGSPTWWSGHRIFCTTPTGRLSKGQFSCIDSLLAFCWHSGGTGGHFWKS